MASDDDVAGRLNATLADISHSHILLLHRDGQLRVEESVGPETDPTIHRPL